MKLPEGYSFVEEQEDSLAPVSMSSGLPEGYSFVEENPKSSIDNAYSTVLPTGYSFIEEEPEPVALPSTVRRLHYGFDKSETDLENAADLLEAKYPLGRIIWQDGRLRYVSPSEAYGEDFASLGYDDRRKRIRSRKNEKLMQEYSDIYNAGVEDSAASTIGEFGGYAATPTSLIPFAFSGKVGVQMLKASAAGAGIGAEDSILYQLAQEGTVDWKHVTATSAMVAAIAPIPVGLTKGMPGMFSSKGARLGRSVKDMTKREAELVMQDMTEDLSRAKIAQMAVDPLANFRSPKTSLPIIKQMQDRYANVAADMPLFEKLAGQKMPKVTDNLAVRDDIVRKFGPGQAAAHIADQWLGVLDTRVRNISVAIWGRLRFMEMNLLKRTHEATMPIEELASSGLPDTSHMWGFLQGQEWSYARGVAQSKGNMAAVAAIDRMQQTLTSIKDDLVKSGVIKKSEVIENYFPRYIKDLEGLRAAMGKKELGIIDKSIAKATKKKGRKLTIWEEYDAINKVFRQRPQGNRGTVLNKKRKFITIPPKYKEFYFTPEESIRLYVRDAVDEIETRSFFGITAKPTYAKQGIINAAKFTNKEGLLNPVELEKSLTPPEAGFKRLYKATEGDMYYTSPEGAIYYGKVEGKNTALEYQDVLLTKLKKGKKGKELINHRIKKEDLKGQSYTSRVALDLEGGPGSSDDSIAKFYKKDNLNDWQQKEIRELLLSRFGPGRTHTSRRIATLKELTYLSMLANPLSAATQLGDTAVSFGINGMAATVATMTHKIVGRAMGSTQMLTAMQGGIGTAAQEMVQPGAIAKFLRFGMKVSGFHGIDQFGKNTFMESAVRKAAKLSSSEDGRLRLYNRYGEAWGEKRTFNLIKELRDISTHKGKLKKDLKVSEEVMQLAVFELMDVQPVSRSQLPQKYLDMPNGSIIYMLNTWGIKMIDVFRTQAFNKMRNGHAKEGAGTLMKLGMFLGSMNTGIDMVKDVMQGREVGVEEMPDRFAENVLQILLVNKYFLSDIKTENISAFVSRFAPGATAASVLESPAGLVGYSMTGSKREEHKYAIDTLSRVPIAGRLTAAWAGGGKEKYNEERREEQKKQRKEEMRGNYATFRHPFKSMATIYRKNNEDNIKFEREQRLKRMSGQ